MTEQTLRPSTNCAFIFFYGTFKDHGHYNQLLQSLDGQFITNARLKYYTMFDSTSGYPFILQSTSGFVCGEVWEIEIKTIAEIDRIEGTSTNLFKRIEEDIETDVGQIAAWIYVGNQQSFEHGMHYDKVRGGNWQTTKHKQDLIKRSSNIH